MTVDQTRFETEIRSMALYCLVKLALAEKDGADIVGMTISSDIRELAGEVDGEEIVVAEHIERLLRALGYEVSESLFGDEIIVANLEHRRDLLAQCRKPRPRNYDNSGIHAT